MPACLRWKNSLKKLINSCENHENSLLFDILQNKVIERLKSRKPPWQHFENVKNFNVNDEWRTIWENSAVFGNEIINDPTKKVPGTELKRKEWVTLNRIRTHQGRCNACLFKWKVVDAPGCDCGAVSQTVAHIVLFCPLRRFTATFEELCNQKTQRAKDYLYNLDILL